MSGMTVLSNIRAEATSTDLRARCERDALWQLSAPMPRKTHRVASDCDGWREGGEQRTH